MNNKGFTVVELITTFCLSAIVILIFFNVVLIIRDVYVTSNLKTKLLINQADLSEALNSKIKPGLLESVQACDDSDFCYKFTFKNGQADTLIVEDNYIKFGNYVYKLDNGTQVIDKSLLRKNMKFSDTDLLDSFLVLNISIKNKLFDDNFGINLVYLYNSNKTSL